MDTIEKRIIIQADALEKLNKSYANYKRSPKERLTVGYVRSRMETLESNWKEFKSVHEKLILAVAKEERQTLNYFADDMFNEFEELYYTYKGEMKCRLDVLVPDKSESKDDQPSSQPSKSSNDVKLPHISLPSFSGNYTEWQSFHDLFVALVHKNDTLENVQKLHYLKGSLLGDAEVLLRQFPITSENYIEAWSILKKRYANKRYIANCIFKKFFAQKSITSESATALRQLLDTSVECMSALRHLGLPTSQWDAIVNFTVVSRLDPVTHKQWEEAISGDESDDLPNFDRLKAFLETRFRTLEMVEPSLTRRLPAREVGGFDWPQIDSMKLADPTFNVPGRIDVLLGADVFGEIIDIGLMRGPGNVVAQNTHLGWILSGDTNPSCTVSQSITTLHITRQVEEDNNLLKKFWEVESELYSKHKMWTKEEEQCEAIYQQTTTRDEEGRYVVQLPLKTTVTETVTLCGNTKQQAVTRFEQLERKFVRNDNLKSKYKKVIHEYLQLGHMKKAEIEDERNSVYLAHHAVIREDKETSKVRVVFDASAKGSNGCSLNKSMMIGPTIQPDLRSLIFRWRSHKICVVGDIIKMYRQVKIADKHTDLQRIVWRDDVCDKIESYKLLTVTFGTAAAPYLAVRTLHRLADDEEQKYPRGAAVVKNSFYMDDLMTGHEDHNELKIICQEIDNLLKAGGFRMQKWSSNSEELLTALEDITKTPTPVKEKMEIKLDKVIKILGLTWDRRHDAFQVSVNLPESRIPVTKRVILSDVASLFDPFGWLSPVVITAKIMIQKLWLCSLGWDDELPTELVDEWIGYRNELEELQAVEIPRWTKMTSQCKNVQLHGFADASTLAFAAVVYVRVVDEDDIIHVTMLASKTKVAPLKQLTIPRLELCAAVLLAKLLHEVSDLLNVPMNRIYAWTDSMVVLSWLQSQPSRWQTFVGNRVSEIIQHIDNDRWRHVISADNPADLASRGIRANDLTHNELWWSGPAWLKDNDLEAFRITAIPGTELESKKIFHVVVEDTPIWERFSSMTRMKRVLAWCRRFLECKNRQNGEDILSTAELNDIETRCVKYYQYQVYSQEIEDLKKKGKIRNKSSLIKLTPYLDEQNLLRVGGRLSKADLSESVKHPIIIPRNRHVTKLIIAEAHRKTLHGTIFQVMSYIRSKYWIIGLKSAVRDFAQKCVVCIRNNASTKQQLMGQLPASRVTQHRAFYHSGVDYAGPVYLRTSKGRGQKSTKGYICLFVCMCTRAIHLEAVTDLTAQAFIAAFRRFVARRGHCAQLWSDNGTNFVGADKEMRDMFVKGTKNVSQEIAELLANDGTVWHFIPAKMPNYGGLWESGVRSAKRHLLRVNGTSKLTYEEMSTLLAQVEACLNSRPLCQLDETVDTLNPLTPGHFLVGEPVINIPDMNHNREPQSIHLLTRWQLIQRQMQDFWKKWQSEYLNTLQQRQKWHDIVPSPSVGDVVIIKEEELPPAKWLLGKITALHPGTDKLVRVVSVKCKGDHILKRPLSKLILLPKAVE